MRFQSRVFSPPVFKSMRRLGRYLGHIAVLRTDRVAWSVGLSITLVSPAKTAEPFDLTFGLWTWAEGSTSSIVFARGRQCDHMEGHIGATWRIRLNRPSAAAMRPYIKLL